MTYLYTVAAYVGAIEIASRFNVIARRLRDGDKIKGS